MSVVFEDIHEFNPTGGYNVPNECILLWRDIVKGLNIYKAGGICSSGEVGLLSILPSVKVNLTLVDHSYSSLFYALMKYFIIKEKGAEEAYKLFTERNQQRFIEALKEARKFIPQKVQEAFDDIHRFEGWRCLSEEYLPQTWKTIPQEDLKKAEKKLSRVKFIHGDLTDLGEGQLDLVYMSNAHEANHHDRNKKRLMLENIQKILKPSGYVLCATNKADNLYSFEQKGWEVIEMKSVSTSNNYNLIRWNQILFRMPS